MFCPVIDTVTDTKFILYAMFFDFFYGFLMFFNIQQKIKYQKAKFDMSKYLFIVLLIEQRVYGNMLIIW